MISAGLLITGNEVLSAKTKDTNGPFMGMHLRRVGVSVRASMMCADSETDLLDCLNYLSERCEIILMTGGLGPTSDDLTADVIAKFFEIPTYFNQEAWEACVDFFVKAGRTSIPESNKKQANLPQGCKLLSNKLGTAAGFSMTGEKFGKKVTVYSMPGVPYEMETMFLESVLPNLVNNLFVPVTLSWQVFFMGESFMQNAINVAEQTLLSKFPGSSISYQAHANYVSYSATLFPSSQSQKEECDSYLKNVFTPSVATAFGENIIYCEDKKVASYIISKLIEKKLSISFVETSCAGYLSKEFSVITHNPELLVATIVANSDLIKKNILDIPKNIIQEGNENPVNLVSYLAINNLKLVKSSISLAEYGFPNDPYIKHDHPYEGFYLAMAFHKDKIYNFDEIEKKLFHFFWKKFDSCEDNGAVVFFCFIKSNKRHVREIQQMRASFYLLCSLAKVL